MFGQRIKALRISTGMNQVEFGKALGVTKQSVSNWENENIMPSIDMLVQIATRFSVSADYLLGFDTRTVLDVTGLTESQIFHVQQLVDDLRKLNR